MNNMIQIKHTLLTLLAVITAGCCFVSCSDMDDLMGDPNAFRVEVVDGQDSVSTRAAYDGYHTDFEAGDAIGVYCFNGSQYLSSNVKFTKQSDGSWLPDGKVVYNPDYTYYAYFPYKSTVYTPTTSGDVESKFSSFVSDNSNYFWQADQSTKEKFTACNLMLSEGVPTGEKKIKFTMQHERGLAVISNPANKWYYSTDEKTTYPCTTVFTTNIPYTLSGTTYYLVKPDTVTTIAGMPLKITKGKYLITDSIRLTGTPSYTYSTSTDDGKTWSGYSSTKPSWLTITPKGEEDKATDFSNAVPVVPIPTAEERNSVLKNNTPVTNYDLSMHNNDGTARTGRTTANCYLVHAPGTYRIPLVYGNAIKDGVGNPSAYHTTATSNTLQNFKNHKDQGIYTGDDTKDPWIKNHGITVNGAKLIWQDVKGLISDVGVDGDYLTFTVDKDNIDEGNALIAATENGTVVWSWHVWVTSETLADSELTSINTGAHTYKVAAFNVGQHAKWKTNRCRVRATSNNVTIQYEVSSLYNGECGTEPYYQWGRKDPELPSIGGYQMDGSTFSFAATTSSVSIGTTIKNPGVHYYTSSNQAPYNESKYNYWDANQTGTDNISTATVKTVYDPCPPDYCIPTGNLYYYMGNNSSYTKWINGNGEIGRIWTKDGANLYLPVSGLRNYRDGSLSGVGSLGLYWSASANYSDGGRSLHFYSGYWGWGYDARVFGFPVRSVLEE